MRGGDGLTREKRKVPLSSTALRDALLKALRDFYGPTLLACCRCARVLALDDKGPRTDAERLAFVCYSCRKERRSDAKTTD